MLKDIVWWEVEEGQNVIVRYRAWYLLLWYLVPVFNFTLYLHLKNYSSLNLEKPFSAAQKTIVSFHYNFRGYTQCQCCGSEIITFGSGSGSYFPVNFGSGSGSDFQIISDSDPDPDPTFYLFSDPDPDPFRILFGSDIFS